VGAQDLGDDEAGSARVVWARVREKLRYLRLRPFETATPEGRSRERYRRAALGTASTLVARGLRIVTTLVTVPLTLHYLGPERYGMWLTISSAITFFSFLDLGIGNALVNLVARAAGREDTKGVRAAVSSALLLLSVMVLALSALFALLYPLVPWPRLFNVTSALAVREAGQAAAVFFGCWAATLVVRLAFRVNQSLQEIHLTNVWEALGNLVGLGLVILFIHQELGLPWLVLALAGSPVLAGVGNAVELFAFRHRQYRPALRESSAHSMRLLVRMGGWFLLMQVGYQLVMNSSNIVVTQLLGPEHVPELAVPARLFALLGMLLNVMVMPLWAAYVEAIARGDMAWVRGTLRQSIVLTLKLSLAPAVVLVALGRPLVALWVGEAVTPSLSLMIALGLWFVLVGFNESLSVFFNGANAVRAHGLIRAFHALLAVVLQVTFLLQWGLTGLVWGLALGELVGRLLPSAFVIPKVLGSLRQ
jgi:O-antigen/teichoic acid export membrane protein